METFDDNIVNPPTAKSLHGRDRFFTRGDNASKLGLFSLGHVSVINGMEDDTPWMDEHAVRIRAGILNIIAWISCINIFFVRDPRFAWIVMSIAAWEFLSSSLFGLTPVAPIGSIATLVSMKLYKDPLWTPAKPKRFAWSLGLTVVFSCLVLWRYAYHVDKVDTYSPVLKGMVISCIILTWLESACGFCLGCFFYNGFRLVSPEDAQLAACKTCQIHVTVANETVFKQETQS